MKMIILVLLKNGGIDLDDEEAVENSELADLEISGYDYSIELVTDYSDLDIDIEKVERWD